jgi:hypothetical protein
MNGMGTATSQRKGWHRGQLGTVLLAALQFGARQAVFPLPLGPADRRARDGRASGRRKEVRLGTLR